MALGVILVALVGQIPKEGDIDPGKLNTVDIAPKLQSLGFKRNTNEYWPPSYRDPRFMKSTLSASFFKGLTEVRYSVMLFKSNAAYKQWDKGMFNNASAWFSPSEKMAQKYFVAKTGKRFVVTRPNDLLVNGRAVISLRMYQHEEMLRRFPDIKDRSLSDAQANRLYTELYRTLSKRVQMLPELAKPVKPAAKKKL